MKSLPLRPGPAAATDVCCSTLRLTSLSFPAVERRRCVSSPGRRTSGDGGPELLTSVRWSRQTVEISKLVLEWKANVTCALVN